MSFATTSTFGMEHSADKQTDGLKKLFDDQFAELNETLRLEESLSWCSCCDVSCCDVEQQ